MQAFVCLYKLFLSDVVGSPSPSSTASLNDHLNMLELHTSNSLYDMDVDRSPSLSARGWLSPPDHYDYGSSGPMWSDAGPSPSHGTGSNPPRASSNPPQSSVPGDSDRHTADGDGGPPGDGGRGGPPPPRAGCADAAAAVFVPMPTRL